MKKVYFITDLHLGATYLEDNKAIERELAGFFDSIKEDAEEIYLLGDILDYWFEYRHVVPRGFVRFFGKLAELSDSGIKITWIIGNHDIWIFDYLPSELGIEVIDGTVERKILGTHFLLQHGDAIGGNRKFRFIRSLFRNRYCQKLYSGIHPRWTVGFAFSWSKRNRLKKKDTGKWPTNLIDEFRKWCNLRIEEGDPAEYFVFGHLHKYYNESLLQSRKLIVLPDWPSTKEYGVFDGKDFQLKQYKGELDMHNA